MGASRSGAAWTQRMIVGERVGEDAPPVWLPDVYRKFHRTLTAEGYPCFFGAEAEKKGHHFYSRVDGNDIAHLPETIMTFLQRCTNVSRDKNNLIVFFEPLSSPLEHSAYRDLFWNTLRYLRDHDPAGFGGERLDLDDPRWEFPFAGSLFFVVGLSPSYRLRRSRNLGPSMIMVFQPRQVFRDHLTGRDISGESRNLIRERLLEWDGVPFHPDLNTYGQPNNREWIQYFLSDDATSQQGRCPLSRSGE
jgi:FPC/CPF motif-containing protein YcgG